MPHNLRVAHFNPLKRALILLAVVDRYWQTLRHLRPRQIWWRFVFRLVRPSTDYSPAPPVRAPAGGWVDPAQRPASLVGPQEFRFLNDNGTLDELGWDKPGIEKLWRYNQHYFDDLNAIDAPTRFDWHLALIRTWIAQNPPKIGSGWEPYPTSLRIANWIKWALAGNELPPAALHSLAIQARWLARRLERHLLGNHLFANAKALIIAGLWFDGGEADQWLKIGFCILAREVPEQILPDGGQFELSTMYHALALEDILDLINITRKYSAALNCNQQKQQADWEARLPDMQHWLHALCHTDGQIAFFNDSAFGIAPTLKELDAYASRLGFQAPTMVNAPNIWLADSGYGRLTRDEATLLVDMAQVGPDYLPGHAHADTLSFEFSLRGQRIIVNSGTSVYGTGPERLRQRGTAAHSTVTIAGEDSSEVWAGFRVARRAKILSAKMHLGENTLIAEGSHDGYRRLSGHPIHHRRWKLSYGSLIVEDRLTDNRHPAQARFHLHPDIAARQVTPDRGICLLPDGRELTWKVKGGEASLEPTTWHPEFGLSVNSMCLVVPLKDGRAGFVLNWT